MNFSILQTSGAGSPRQVSIKTPRLSSIHTGSSGWGSVLRDILNRTNDFFQDGHTQQGDKFKRGTGCPPKSVWISFSKDLYSQPGQLLPVRLGANQARTTFKILSFSAIVK